MGQLKVCVGAEGTSVLAMGEEEARSMGPLWVVGSVVQ